MKAYFVEYETPLGDRFIVPAAAHRTEEETQEYTAVDVLAALGGAKRTGSVVDVDINEEPTDDNPSKGNLRNIAFDVEPLGRLALIGGQTFDKLIAKAEAEKRVAA